MVNFGQRLSLLSYEPWQIQYLDYDRLKSILETEVSQELWSFREREFVRQLNREIEKIVLFFLEQQGILASRLSALQPEERDVSMQVRELASHPSSSSEAMTLSALNSLSQQYSDIGQDLLHLIHYVELNVTGVRKILKKHDKLSKNNKLSDRYLSEHYWEKQDSHLKQLLHYEGVGAIVATLQESLSEIRALELILQDSMSARDAGNANDAKARHRRISTAPAPILADNMASPGGTPFKSWKPATPQTKTKSPSSDELYDDYGSSLALEDPILLKIQKARRRLQESSNFVQTLATAGEMALMERISSEEDLAQLQEEKVYPPVEKSRISNILNLLSTFLYMTNYYIVAPTSGKYAAKLGGNEALAGLIIGMTPIAALVSTILYSWWTSHSYKAALVFASSCSIIGNILYALGLPCDNIMLLMIGRLLNGFGSARSINRRYIADSFSREERTAASAAFVTAGALGMAAGPAMAAFLDVTTPDDKVWWSAENAPGWFMCGSWSIYLVVLICRFKDPPHHFDDTPKPSKDVEMTGERRALLASVKEEEEREALLEDEGVPPLWRNIPVVTTLFIYFVLKLALECCLSSTATLTDYYFDWGTQESGMYLAVLGLLMFPANLLVAYFSRRYEDRELIVATLWILLVGVVGIIDYGNPASYTLLQYITFGVCIFVSSNALEAPNMALLSKTIPKSMAKGLFNVGLLATEAGTLGRAVGDVFITWCGLESISYLLNNMFISMAVIVGLTLVGTYRAYPFLEPFDKDD